MRSGSTRVFVVLVLLALGGTLLLPSATALGKKKKKAKKRQMRIAQRVEYLQQQVSELKTRVEVLEGGSSTFDVIHLEPLADFPASLSDGDLCVVGESGSRHIYSYLNGDWRQLDPGAPPL